MMDVLGIFGREPGPHMVYQQERSVSIFKSLENTNSVKLGLDML